MKEKHLRQINEELINKTTIMRRILLIIFAIISIGEAMAQISNSDKREQNQFHVYKIYSHKGRVNASSDVWLICNLDSTQKYYTSFTLFPKHNLNPGPGTPQYYVWDDTTFVTTIPIDGKIRLKYSIMNKNMKRQRYNDDNILEDKGLWPVFETTVKFNGKKPKDKALKAKVKLRFVDRNNIPH